MIIIQDKLISDNLIEEHFLCQLDACKGACCWEGDYGAPLEDEELEILEQLYPLVAPYLSKRGQAVIEKEGTHVYFEKAKENGTPLIDNGACAYMTLDNEGVAQCGIEQAYFDKKIDFRKPISCHLYPIRVATNEARNFEALNYDQWDICSAACSNGKKESMPVYKFAREALVRKYGQAFYDELAAAAEHVSE